MTIASATTTTELVWQEVDVVSFTEGTLADMDALKAEVAVKLQRGTLTNTTTPTTSEVQTWLVRSIEETMEAFDFNFSRRYAYAACVAGTYRYALPPDFGGGSTTLRDTTNNKTLTYVDNFTFDRAFPDVSDYGNAYPSNWTIKDRELWIQPPASGTNQLELEYRSTGEARATVITHIPEPFRFKIIDGALAEAWEHLHEFEKAQYYKQKHMGGLQQAKRADGKQKWAAQGYMCRHWLY